MKCALFSILLILSLGLAGCATTQSGETSASQAPASPRPLSQAPVKASEAPAEAEPQDSSLEEAIAQSARHIAANLPQGSTVAIIAFESEQDNFSEYIMEELTDYLMDLDITVADRNNLTYVKRELNFQMSGDVDDDSAVSIGKMLGAHLVITGQMINAGETYQYRVNAIKVETAVRDSSIRFKVRNDQNLGNLIAALAQNTTTTKSRDY